MKLVGLSIENSYIRKLVFCIYFFCVDTSDIGGGGFEHRTSGAGYSIVLVCTVTKND